MKKESKLSLWYQFLWRVSSVHIVTYFLFGLIFYTLLNYTEAFTISMLSSFMRPTSSPWVAAGPMLQVVRGVILTFILWPIKDAFLNKDKGWSVLWGLFVGLAILGTAGPAPGSIEGIIYTKIPITYHLYGLPEILLQTLFFSLGLYYWYKKPSKVWNILMSIATILIILMSLAGAIIA